MNSRGHLYISLAKSFIHIVSAILSIWLKQYEILALGIVVVEIGGILEEVFDER